MGVWVTVSWARAEFSHEGWASSVIFSLKTFLDQ